MKKEDKLRKVFVIYAEMQMRCGDGMGKITSHSINCKCKELKEQLETIKQQEDL
jgi:hypothetical protein